jgi:hypothetical protein
MGRNFGIRVCRGGQGTAREQIAKTGNRFLYIGYRGKDDYQRYLQLFIIKQIARAVCFWPYVTDFLVF